MKLKLAVILLVLLAAVHVGVLYWQVYGRGPVRTVFPEIGRAIVLEVSAGGPDRVHAVVEDQERDAKRSVLRVHPDGDVPARGECWSVRVFREGGVLYGVFYEFREKRE